MRRSWDYENPRRMPVRPCNPQLTASMLQLRTTKHDKAGSARLRIIWTKLSTGLYLETRKESKNAPPKFFPRENRCRPNFWPIFAVFRD